ncbi:DNA-binding protein [Mycobacterium sp. ITM-2017-0098]|nr:DNA-binding protein [Mycobacterium sp. ITM-2017-0098]
MVNRAVASANPRVGESAVSKGDEALVKTRDVAEFLGVTMSQLARWRFEGVYGPPFYKLGHSVRYRLSDVEQWLQNCRTGVDR